MMGRSVKVSLLPREREGDIKALCEECGCELLGLAALAVGSGSLSNVSLRVKVAGEFEAVRRLFDKIEGRE